VGWISIVKNCNSLFGTQGTVFGSKSFDHMIGLPCQMTLQVILLSQGDKVSDHHWGQSEGASHPLHHANVDLFVQVLGEVSDWPS